jgi:hypothetical protein
LELVFHVAVAKSFKVKGELNPFGFAGLGVKFEFTGGAISACEKFEEPKSLEVDSSQVALMYSCHISSTVERA